MSDRTWTVKGYENGEVVFEHEVSVDSISESEVKELLKRLAARAMTEAEVVAASLSSDHRGAELSVSETDEGDFGFTTDPAAPRYYVATLSDVEDGPHPV